MGLLDGNGLFCLMTGNGDEVSLQLWKDEFGNDVCGFFTTRELAEAFVAKSPAAAGESRPRKMIGSHVAGIISEQLSNGTAFFAIDPLSPEGFESLNGKLLLTRLFVMGYEEGIAKAVADRVEGAE